MDVRKIAEPKLTRRCGLYAKTGVSVTLVVMMIHTAIYARVSTKDGRQDTENQLRQLRRYARKQGYAITAEYVDRKSGGTADREAFKQLFADAHQRKFDLVLFWSLDRFSREGALKTLTHLERLTGYGVQWQSFTQEYLTNVGPFGEAIVAIMAALAAQERQVLRERTKAGLERAKAQGKTLGRPRKVFDRAKVRAMRKAGHSYWNIARVIGVSPMHCYRICKVKE